MCRCVQMCAGPTEGRRWDPSGAGVGGISELPDMGAGVVSKHSELSPTPRCVVLCTTVNSGNCVRM